MAAQPGNPRLLLLLVSAAMLLTASACDGKAVSEGRPDKPSTGSGLTVSRVSAILTAFDAADSAASTAGDIAALREQETGAALDSSIAAVRRSAAAKRTQAPYYHTDPTFAVPAGGASCFLVAASLQSSGAELGQTDVSQFTALPDGSWRLSHHVLVGQDASAEVHTIGGEAAKHGNSDIPNQRLTAIADEIFARTTASTPSVDLVAISPVLDQQLAAGWQIYQKQMRFAGMSVSRVRTTTSWSDCVAQAGTTSLVFLNLELTDTVVAAAGGHARAMLSAKSPDLIGLGRSTDATGSRIAVNRVESFLVSISPDTPATVLGLTDAPTALTVHP